MYKLNKHIEGGSRYDRRISRLTDRVKYAIFFAHTATKRNYTTLGSNSLCNSKETVLDCSSLDIDNCSDSTRSYTTNQLNGIDDVYVDKNSDNAYLNGNKACASHDDCADDTYLDEYEDVDEFEDVAFIMKSTKKCRDELINRLNNSYNNPEDVKLLYCLSPIDYRINSLKNALEHLNNINKSDNLM